MNFLTHYYRIGGPPFRSLSLLSDSDALCVAEKFQDETALVYRRFKKPRAYWTRRRNTEKWLRKEISFTYSDSMVSHWLLEQQDKEYFHPEYHGKVFTLSEIGSVVQRYGFPDQEWNTDPTRAFDFFIEAQVWNPKSLENYVG